MTDATDATRDVPADDLKEAPVHDDDPVDDIAAVVAAFRLGYAAGRRCEQEGDLTLEQIVSGFDTDLLRLVRRFLGESTWI